MQKAVKEFLDEFSLHTSPETRYLDLVAEIGELGKEILKATDYGKKYFVKTTQIAEETGDCLFSLLALCEELGVNGEEVLLRALAKYRKRFEEKGSIDSGK
ncbi:MAG: MazG-like family protein [Defluviitaleaceae bacterium]|nr:MazG-like family protein [Defluviitaleaceae bacterium]